ncbi:NfeD family protein [Hypericibacter sp.]|uniref:NfeD family protein n=1 Tax=Hypericibacter sp. TaxID=2705401 RepID=UPI003D6CF923
MDLKGAVSPFTADYVVRGLHRAADDGANVIVLRIDTPGGLDSSMREIIRAILASPVPVIGYVAPGGARAASAGTYIIYACHIAAMAPGTNLGAATPINLFGGDESTPEQQPGSQNGKAPSDASSPQTPAPQESAPQESPENPSQQIRPPNAELTKITNDAAAYIRGLAQLRHRNVDWAERAVREAVSLSNDEALKANVIDLVADNLEELLAKVNGRSVPVLGTDRVLETGSATVVALEPDWRTRLLATLTDPSVAYLLLLIGIYGLIFEFSHPGIFAPGVIGTISLVLGLLALSVIPIDLAGLGLMLLGIGLMAAEAFIPSFGAFVIGGATAFVIGSLMTFDVPGYRLAWPVIAGATIASIGLFLLVLAMLLRARRRPVSSGDAALVNTAGEVISWTDGEGQVLAMGERWRARGPGSLAAGQQVRVVGRDGLILRVEPR